MRFFSRSGGILLHPTSLPGPYGIGDLGPQAYRFVDWLTSTGCKLSGRCFRWDRQVWRLAVSVSFLLLVNPH
jgi:hypothetical protein